MFGVAAFLLAACRQHAPHAGPAALPTPDLTAPVPAHTLAPELPTHPPAPLSEAHKGPAGARAVLRAWAADLEGRNYDAAYALWGPGAEARSGMGMPEHRQWWGRFKTVNIAAQDGQVEGAAGSSFYTAPVAIVGKLRNGRPYRLEGTVTLRRVNDVPGASPAQLRWHLDKADLHPAS